MNRSAADVDVNGLDSAENPRGARFIGIPKTLLWAAAFFVFLYPVVGFELLSVNYSFALVPVFGLFLGGNLRKPPALIVLAMGLYFLIYAFSSIARSDAMDLGPRPLVSFIVFLQIFAFCFVKMEQRMVEGFKLGSVLISVYFSLLAMGTFFAANLIAPLGYEAKDLVGSQRFGFIYLLAFWSTVTSRPERRSAHLWKYAVITILLAGLSLTFSRASIASLVASAGLFALVNHWRWMLRPTLKGIAKAVGVAGGIVFLFVVLSQLMPVTMEFYNDRLLGAIGTANSSLIDNPETSEGERIHILKTSMDYIVDHPLVGSGYLGVWILPYTFSGSAHNQYLDVLFRTGVFGFALYCFLLLKIAIYLYRSERGLFWGFFAMLVYGFFHETFKESQGACALAFLMGMMVEAQRSRRARVPGPLSLVGEAA